MAFVFPARIAPGSTPVPVAIQALRHPEVVVVPREELQVVELIALTVGVVAIVETILEFIDRARLGVIETLAVHDGIAELLSLNVFAAIAVLPGLHDELGGFAQGLPRAHNTRIGLLLPLHRRKKSA